MADMKSYRSFISDNSRWEGFEFRDDDIVISTPAKCGTTWTQMLCALLIFDSPDLPGPLAQLSPWLDLLTHSRDEIVALLENQEHRRFIKTHTPLDGLPQDPRVTYVCVGRDPRDVQKSWQGHLANLDVGAFMNARAAAVGLDDVGDYQAPAADLPTDAHGLFWAWAAADGSDLRLGPTLPVVLEQIQGFWDARNEPNVGLFHYADYKADLPGEMQRLASLLGIDLAPDRIAELAEAASFESMKRNADAMIPDNGKSIFKDNSGFFNAGANGQWRELLDDDDLARYDKRVAELVSGDCATWVHDGWIASGMPRPATSATVP